MNICTDFLGTNKNFSKATLESSRKNVREGSYKTNAFSRRKGGKENRTVDEQLV